MTLAAFGWTQLQLADEERRLRLSAQHDVVVYTRLLEELAQLLAPELVEQKRRFDPAYFLQLNANGWQQMFQTILAQRENWQGWRGESPRLKTLTQQVVTLTAHNQTLLAEVSQLRSISSITSVNAKTVPVEQANEAHTESSRRTSHVTALPDRPPPAFADCFTNWPREGLTLALLATTGWSLRYALAEELGRRLGITANAGSLKRLFTQLEKAELWIMRRVELERSDVILVSLSDKGKQVMQACGLAVVESEFEILYRLHGGGAQLAHTALVCCFTQQARQRGYHTEVCPALAGASSPDVRLSKDTEQILVEVEAESGEVERRMRKWRNLADQQGYVALCAPTVESRNRLIAEARAASEHGRATDLDTLFKQENLWAVEW